MHKAAGVCSSCCCTCIIFFSVPFTNMYALYQSGIHYDDYESFQNKTTNLEQTEGFGNQLCIFEQTDNLFVSCLYAG